MALREIYESCAPAAFRRARLLLGDDEEAWDVVHEVFARLADPEARRPLLLDPMRYVYRATTNACLDALDARRLRAGLRDLPTPQPAEVAAAAQARDLLAKLDVHLDATDRRILVLAFFDGLTQDEIAAVLGVWRRTVGRRLARIRTMVDGLEGGGGRS